MLFFSTQLFDDISGNGPMITLLIGIFIVVGALISIFTAKMKRRLTYGLALISQGIGILLVAIAVWIPDGTLAIAGVILYMIAFSIGNGSMLFIYISEIVPHSGIGVAMGAQWISSAIIGIGAVPLKDKIGIASVFMICAGLIFVQVIVLFWLGVETRGKTPHEIDAIYLGEVYTKHKKRDSVSHPHVTESDRKELKL